jgi:hypothetical protein
MNLFFVLLVIFASSIWSQEHKYINNFVKELRDENNQYLAANRKELRDDFKDFMLNSRVDAKEFALDSEKRAVKQQVCFYNNFHFAFIFYFIDFHI